MSVAAAPGFVGSSLNGMLTPEEALAISDQIVQARQHLCFLVRRAHEGQAWAALGFSSWGNYCTEKLDMSRQYANHLVRMASMLDALASLAQTDPDRLALTERSVRCVDQDDAVRKATKALRSLPRGADEEERVKAVRSAVRTAKRLRKGPRNRSRVEEAAAALKREEARRLAKAVSGDPAAAYAEIRKAAAHLDAALASARDVEERVAYGDALNALHRAEDAVVAALRLSRRDLP